MAESLTRVTDLGMRWVDHDTHGLTPEEYALARKAAEYFTLEERGESSEGHRRVAWVFDEAAAIRDGLLEELEAIDG